MTITEMRGRGIIVGNLEWVDVSYTEKDGTQKKRAVSQIRDIEPSLEIPAGTLYRNGRKLSKSTTNLELMKSGKSPFVPLYNEQGEVIEFHSVELHHTEQSEISGLYKFMKGENWDGSLMEIDSTIHDKYKTVLHIKTESGTSFRVRRVNEVDENGNVVRKTVTTKELRHYRNFSRHYWKERAKGFQMPGNDKY